jgi:hypothetical protein
VAVDAFPTKAPLNVGEFNTPDEGLKVSFALLTLAGKLPVLPSTNVIGMFLLVAKSSVMATLAALVAFVALLAIPFRVPVNIPSKFGDINVPVIGRYFKLLRLERKG